LANTRFQTVYNYIGLGLNFEIRGMEFGEMKRNTSNWSNFCMLLPSCTSRGFDSVSWAFLFWNQNGTTAITTNL